MQHNVSSPPGTREILEIKDFISTIGENRGVIYINKVFRISDTGAFTSSGFLMFLFSFVLCVI